MHVEKESVVHMGDFGIKELYFHLSFDEELKVIFEEIIHENQNSDVLM